MNAVTNVDEGILEKEITTADYVCFHVHEGKRLAAVLLETKMQKAFKMNSIAQLVGYYLRSPSISIQPAVCIVLTEATMHMILFLFLDQHGSSLVNAVQLKPIYYQKIACSIIVTCSCYSQRFSRYYMPARISTASKRIL